MSLGKDIAQTVAGIPGCISPDHMSEADLDALAYTLRDTLNAVEEERADRLAALCGRLPVSFPWPGEVA